MSTEILDSNLSLAEIKGDKTDDEMFEHAVRHLRAMQHEIDDTAQQASIELNKLCGRYNYWFNYYAAFLRKHATEHAKRKNSGEMVKHYKTITAGGGVYFREIKPKYIFSQEELKRCYENGMRDAIAAEVSFVAIEPEKLIAQGIGTKEPGDPLGKIYVGTSRPWTHTKAKSGLTSALDGVLTTESEEVALE